MDSEQTAKPQQAQAAATQDAAQEMRREIVEFVKMIVWFLILFFVITTYVIEGYEVQGDSMTPTLTDRERILVFKLTYNLSRLRLFSALEPLEAGDIVVFYSPDEKSRRYVKRLIAKGPPLRLGNTVEAQKNDVAAQHVTPVTVGIDAGQVYVNHKRIHEPYLPENHRAFPDSLDEISLAPGAYYVMGDNRAVSKDSRRFGPVGDDRIIGKAVLCFWPPHKIRLL